VTFSSCIIVSVLCVFVAGLASIVTWGHGVVFSTRKYSYDFSQLSQVFNQSAIFIYNTPESVAAALVASVFTPTGLLVFYIIILYIAAPS
jgi:hypothetical protein